MNKEYPSSRYFRLLARHSKELMMLLDSHFVISDVNNIISRIAKFEPAELENQSLKSFLASNSETRTLQILEEFANSEAQSKPIQLEIRDKTAGIVSLKGTISRISEEAEEQSYLLNLQQEKTKNVFEGARTQLETLLANTEESFIVVDANFNISILNKAAKIHSKAILGEEMQIGKSILDYADPDRLSALKAMFEQVLAGNKVSYEVAVGLEKTSVYILKYIPIKNQYDEINGIFIITEDITKQKQQLAHIKESEFRFRSIFENTKDGVILSYTDGTNFAANSAILELIGYSHEEFANLKREDLLDLSHPNINKWLTEREINRYWNGELTAISKNGDKIPVHVSNVIFEDAIHKGNTLSVFTVRDRREEKKIENERSFITSISQSLLSDYSFAQSLHQLLVIVNKYFGFSLGEVWMPDMDYKRMRLKVNRAENSSLSHIVENSKYVYFDVNEGFPGKCFHASEVSFVKDFITDINFHRKELFGNSKLKGVFCVPLFTESERLGVLLLFVENVPTPKELNETKALLQSMANQISPEFKLKKAEEELRTFFETSPDLLGIAGKDGNFKRINRAFTQLLGYTREEILSTQFSEFLHPDDLSKTKQLIEQQFENSGTKYFENRYITKSGEIVWIAWAGQVSVVDEIAYLVGKNISESKAIEKELSLNQRALETALNNLDSLTNNSPDIICTISKDGRFISVNKTCEKILGYSPNQLQGVKYIDLVREEDKPMTNRVAEAIMSGKPTTNFDNRYLSKNGDLVPLIWSAWYSQEDEIMYAVARDGREKIAQEEEIKKINEKLVDVLENTGDGFSSISNDYKITYWNKLAERYSGLSRNEVLGKDIREISYAYPGSKFYKELDIAMRNREISRFEEYMPELDYWYATSLYPTHYGISIFVRNITKEKKGMELFKASHERYQFVFKASNEAIYDWDVINKRLMFGDGYTTTYGYEAGANMPLAEWSSKIHPEDQERIEADLTQVVANSTENIWKASYRYMRKDGEYVYVNDVGHIIRNREGEAIRMVGAMRDVTEDKKHQKLLVELNTELAKQAKELANSNEELESFAYVVSHDLQEPLRMVTSFLQLLERKYNDLIDDRGKQYIHFAVDGASRMKTILIDLLEYSRVGNEKGGIKDVNLNKVMESVLKNMRSTLESIPKSRIDWDELPTIKANQTEMVQLFQNLLSNALKYRSNQPPAVFVHNKSTADYWLIGVRDNGIGIDKLYFDKIFIIFQRLHTDKKYQGTGIGLAICKKIVENLHGKIWVESEVDKGSTFWIELPKNSYFVG
ncbi:PAS domain S-box protein [Fulvivirgaceae bacterium LMO-SS25]